MTAIVKSFVSRLIATLHSVPMTCSALPGGVWVRLRRTDYYAVALDLCLAA
jgi:hypothetical protein